MDTKIAVGAEVVGRDMEAKRRPGVVQAVKEVEAGSLGVITLYRVVFNNHKGCRWCVRDEVEVR